MLRKLLFLFLVLFPASAWALQITDLGGWSFTQRFQGTSNASGTVLKTDSTVGYAADRYMNLYAGLPLYFSRPDARVARRGSPEFPNGVGNLYVGVQSPVHSEVADYTLDIVVMAPTGSKTRGLNTGRVTFDWNNDLRHSFGVVTPYGDLGVGNTILDSSYFVRPFASLGLVSHFEGGAVLGVGSMMAVGGSAYSVRAIGTQRVISCIGPFVGDEASWSTFLTSDLRIESK